MVNVAIVTAFSEPCYELCRQFIVSCWESIKRSATKAEYHFFCYECNLKEARRDIPLALNNQLSNPFTKNIQMRDELPIDVAVTQRDASKLNWVRALADIMVYHDFAQNDLDDFDYVFFCHDDIYVRPGLMFDDIINILNGPIYNLVSEVAVVCNEKDISLRFRPSFIAVRSDKFRRAKLSFINSHQILAPESRRYNILNDGGAELLASYYHTNNTSPGIPFTKFPNNWFKHLRINSDYGIEMHNLISPNDPQFQKLIEKAKRYSDFHLYGQADSN